MADSVGGGRATLAESAGAVERVADLVKRYHGAKKAGAIDDAVLPDGAAQRAGLREGDKVVSVGAVPVVDGQQLRGLIRASVSGTQGLAQDWRIERGGQTLQLSVRPDAVQQDAPRQDSKKRADAEAPAPKKNRSGTSHRSPERAV